MRDDHVLRTYPIEYSFREYAAAETAQRNSPAMRRAEAYWLKRLAALPPAPELPLAVSPGAVTHPSFTRRSARLESSVWRRLKERAANFGFTPSAVLLTAYAETIATWSKSRRFCLNVTLVNRPPSHPQVNEIVGDFTSFIPLAVDHSAAESFELRAGVLQGQLCEDLEHCRFNGVRIIRELARVQGKTAGACLPVVFTSLLGHEQRATASPMLWMGEAVYGVSQTPQVWLDHQVMEQDGALIFHWDAVEELFPPRMLDEMFAAYRSLLRRLDESDAAWHERALCLTPAGSLARRAEVNNTAGPVSDKLLHELFAEQARVRPQQEAVITPERAMTYAELQHRADGLARQLRLSGAQPNQLVAIVMEKGWEQVVAALAVSQAGAAYLPIAADTPRERLWQTLDHAQAGIVLTQSRYDRRIEWPDRVTRIAVDSAAADGGGETPLTSARKPDDLAYVIINGFRVELGEIEAALAQHPQVRSAVVIAAGESRTRRRLVAYIAAGNKPQVTTSELRDFVCGKLPAYMAPASFIFLETLPLTQNGKVDRKALAGIATSVNVDSSTLEAAPTDVEARIRQIVESALRCNGIEPQQNLLDLGADSLDIVSIINRLEQEFGFRPKIEEFYSQPTVAQLVTAYQRRLRGH